MIRLPLQNRTRPIQLLREDQADHDVRKSELGEG